MSEVILNFQRVYVPNTTFGVETNKYRVCNIQPSQKIENISVDARLPIKANQPTGNIILLYSIKDLKNVNEARSSDIRDDLVGSYITNEIVGVDPVRSTFVNNEYVISFTIKDLEDIGSTKSAVRIGQYNSRSITALTAARPLKASTLSAKTTVQFEMTSLPDA